MMIAIITARGGSKRIPQKNIKLFCGKPILTYSISAAVESNLFDEVMVSTDDEGIAEIARTAGATVPFMRSEKTANDYASTSDVLLEVLEQYQQRGRTFSTMACLYPTAPFITAAKLTEANRVFEDEDVEAVVPVVEFSFSPLRGFVIRDDHLQLRWPEYRDTRSQDIEPIFHDSGQFYLCRVAPFLKKRAIFACNPVPFILSELEVQDIDDQTDWELAELKYQLLKEKGLL